jgi:hypothetical protein
VEKEGSELTAESTFCCQFSAASQFPSNVGRMQVGSDLSGICSSTGRKQPGGYFALHVSFAHITPTWLDVRISIPGPAHSAPGSEEPCSTETWVILEEEDEEVDQEKDVHFFVQVWQVIHLHQAIDRPEGEQT